MLGTIDMSRKTPAPKLQDLSRIKLGLAMLAQSSGMSIIFLYIANKNHPTKPVHNSTSQEISTRPAITYAHSLKKEIKQGSLQSM